ncbi:hypothetical protein M8818_004528 [Zalaria obscura]|uniref:Uncharacterized protein n=1 Tax=Zalaria obscura TaxID=2024903 RepID=A0ACC3SBD6_9PEZI
MADHSDGYAASGTSATVIQGWRLHRLWLACVGPIQVWTRNRRIAGNEHQSSAVGLTAGPPLSLCQGSEPLAGELKLVFSACLEGKDPPCPAAVELFGPLGDRRFAILIARLELEGPGVGEISSMFTRKFVCDGGRVQVTPLIVFHHLRKSNWPCPGGGPPIFFPRSTRPRPISGTPLITLLMMIIYKILLNKEPQLRMTPSANCVTPLGSPCKPYQGNPIVSRLAGLTSTVPIRTRTARGQANRVNGILLGA